MAFDRLLDNVDLHDELADFLLEALDLAILVGLVVERPAPLGILGAREEPLTPLLELGHSQAMFAGSFRH